MRPLSHDDILRLHAAALSAGLGDLRNGLLVGLPPSFTSNLPTCWTKSEQFLSDLHSLSVAGELSDGTAPLLVFLKNAIALTSERTEATVFREILDSYASPTHLKRPSSADVESRSPPDYLSQLRDTKLELKRVLDLFHTRPDHERQFHRLALIGPTLAGKTILGRVMASPLFGTGPAPPTHYFDRYRRPISVVYEEASNRVVHHDLEIWDWAGPRIVEANNSIVEDDIRAVVFVASVAANSLIDDAKIIADALPFFCTGRAASRLKAMLLFINQIDTLPVARSEADPMARELYADLIESFCCFRAHVRIEVMTGSALTGESVPNLFSHLVNAVLPKSAYDQELSRHATWKSGA